MGHNTRDGPPVRRPILEGHPEGPLSAGWVSGGKRGAPQVADGPRTPVDHPADGTYSPAGALSRARSPGVRQDLPLVTRTALPRPPELRRAAAKLYSLPDRFVL